MIVISDTTPISELSKVGQLELIRDLFGRVIVPNEVYTELLAGSHIAAEKVPTIDWIEVRAVTNTEKVKALQQTSNLHIGEAAAIVLAEELKADQLLVDEKAARRVAIARQLPVIGTVGILLLAKEQGLIENVKAVLDALIENGTRIGMHLYEQALILAKEDR